MILQNYILKSHPQDDALRSFWIEKDIIFCFKNKTKIYVKSKCFSFFWFHDRILMIFSIFSAVVLCWYRRTVHPLVDIKIKKYFDNDRNLAKGLCVLRLCICLRGSQNQIDLTARMENKICVPYGKFTQAIQVE